MASINFGPFGENWFKKPPNPFPPINILTVAESLNPFKPQSKTLKFASISSSTPFEPRTEAPKEEPEEEPGKYTKMLGQFFWECENRPDYRHAPEVEKILRDQDSVFEEKENPSPEELEENKQWWSEFRDSPIVGFLQKATEIADKLNEMELEENSSPFRGEDAKYWKSIPHVMGLDGRPMPRKAIRTQEESNDKFWDFTKEFFFGLWAFKQRPYPRGRPIDVAQAIGYKQLEDRYYDFVMKTSGWYYKDRLGRTRGPMELIQLKTAWGGGIIDKHTFIWGEDMDEWAPIGMIYGMERAIATWEVRLGAAATAFIHKLQKGIPPWVPLKGHENKTYKQLQEEAYENKRRDLAVLEANDGVWPGVRIPSHALFLWASGSELTPILEADHMPNKYIPKEMRLKLAELVPGLRPWEVLSIEQAMDHIVYGGQWYREPLGSYRTGPPYLIEWNSYMRRTLKNLGRLMQAIVTKVEAAIPGYSALLKEYYAQSIVRRRRRQKEKIARDLAKQVAELKAQVDQGSSPYFPPEEVM